MWVRESGIQLSPKWTWMNLDLSYRGLSLPPSLSLSSLAHSVVWAFDYYYQGFHPSFLPIKRGLSPSFPGKRRHALRSFLCSLHAHGCRVPLCFSPFSYTRVTNHACDYFFLANSINPTAHSKKVPSLSHTHFARSFG